jgi:hypothetical protein
MPGEAELIMFAIRSAVKLGRQSRAAYVDAVRRRELVLPLPGFPAAITVDSAGGYFVGEGRRHLQASARLTALVDRWKARTALTSEEEAELRAARCESFVRDLAGAGLPVTATDASLFDPEDLETLLRVRQWGRGTDPTPSALQRVGGALIEIGADYLGSVPGALDRDSTTGKLAEALLAGLEPLELSEVPVHELPARLFVATLETVATRPELLTGDPKVQELVRVTSRGLAQDVGARVALMRQRGDTDSSREERVAAWGELVFRSLLATGARTVLEDPATFLGVGRPGEAAIVSEVGKGMLGLVLDGPEAGLDRVFSREGIDGVLKAALGAVGRHPEILARTGNRGLQALLVSVATELGRIESPLTPAVLPEVTRLILDKTGEHLDLVWPELATRPERHLLLTAAATALAILAAPPPSGARWPAALGRDELLAVTRTVLDELVQNPAWLLAAAGEGDARLRATLEPAVGVLRARGTAHLGAGTAGQVLQAAIRAVGLRVELLDRMPAGEAMAGQPVVAAALDAMLAAIFEPPGARAAWRVARAETVVAMVQLGLGELARHGAGPAQVATLDALVREQVAGIEAGRAWDLEAFAVGLHAALGA